MSDNDLRELADSVFGGADGSATGLDGDLWRACAETGLSYLTVPEASGGSGGSLLDAAVVLSSAGRHAARIPLVESDLLGGWLLARAGLPVGRRPITAVAAGGNDLERAGDVVSATLRRVPWARAAERIVVVADDEVIVLDPSGAEITEGHNLADEPRDDVTVRGVLPLQTCAVGPEVAREFVLRAALGRALLMAGAASRAVAVSIRYSTERVQFGRPIGRMQAIQQELALACGEVAAATAAADAAARSAHDDGVLAAAWAIAAAKTRCGDAAGLVARICHQVLGAIGFTREHHLRLSTTRLWAWRDEDGGEAQWSEWLGRHVVAAGPDGLWPSMVEAP